jgi:nucleoside-diphosphate-sugar epimerase
VTVLGATGFIGSHLTAALRHRGFSVGCSARGEDLNGANLGTVFYCIGLTADFRARPLETVEAHVCNLRDILSHSEFEMLVYLSSTRLYRDGLGVEDAPIRLNPSDVDDVYNLSKAMGESLALHSGRPVRVARLANVYGLDWHSSNFLPSLIRMAVGARRIVLRTSLQSTKDYISVADVVEILMRVAFDGHEPIYNVASGTNTSTAGICERLCQLCGCTLHVDADAPTVASPTISIDRVQQEFDFRPRMVLDDLPDLVQRYRERREAAA